VRLVFAPPMVLTEAERQALFEEMMAEMDVVEHVEIEELSDDEVSEMGNTTIVPVNTAAGYAVMEELDRLRAMVSGMYMQTSPPAGVPHTGVVDDVSVHTTPLK